MRLILALVLAVGLSLPAFADTGIIGRTKFSTTAQTVTATAYEALDLVGGKITITSAVREETNSGIIQHIVITDLAAQAGSYDVVFFSSDPSGTTFTDEAALDIADADLPKVIGIVPVTTTGAFNDNGVSAAYNIGLPFNLGSGVTTLYAAIVVRSTPTYASTADVQIRVSILQD